MQVPFKWQQLSSRHRVIFGCVSPKHEEAKRSGHFWHEALDNNAPYRDAALRCLLQLVGSHCGLPWRPCLRMAARFLSQLFALGGASARLSALICEARLRFQWRSPSCGSCSKTGALLRKMQRVWCSARLSALICEARLRFQWRSPSSGSCSKTGALLRKMQRAWCFPNSDQRYTKANAKPRNSSWKHGSENARAN